RVVDRARLGRREGVAERISRVAQAAEAEVDDARALADCPADRRGLRAERDLLTADDLRDHELGREGDPCDAEAVVRRGSDLARDEGAVPLLVGEWAPTHEALRSHDATGEVGMAAVDSGVDDGDADARARKLRQLRRPEVEGVILRQVPLPRRER